MHLHFPIHQTSSLPHNQNSISFQSKTEPTKDPIQKKKAVCTSIANNQNTKSMEITSIITPDQQLSINKGGGRPEMTTTTTTTTTSSRKRLLKKLRSVKVANLDHHRLRLSMKRDNPIIDHHRLINLSDRTFSGVVESSPGYMKATSSSAARNELSIASPGIRSAKHFRRMASLKSRRGSKLGRTRVATMRKVKEDEDATASILGSPSVLKEATYCLDKRPAIEDSEVRATVKGRLDKSRSIKLTRIRSIRPPRRQLKIRLGQALVPTSGRYTQPTTLHGIRDYNLQKSARKETPAVKPSKFLLKVMSIRSRRRNGVMKGIDTRVTYVERATCSSTLKSCNKMPEHPETHSGGCESNGISTIHICPYSYCSLHGHYRFPQPPVSTFSAAKRQLIGANNDTHIKNELDSSSESCASSKTTGGMDWPGAHEAASSKGHSQSDSVLDERAVADSNMEPKETVPTAADNGFRSLVSQSIETSTPTRKRMQDCVEIMTDSAMMSSTFSNKALEEQPVQKDGTTSPFILPETPTENSSPRGTVSPGAVILSDHQKYSKMWHLIYQHVISKRGQTESERGKRTNAEETYCGDNTSSCLRGNSIDTSQDSVYIHDKMDENNADVESNSLEIGQLHDLTVKLVEDAVSEILSHHELPSTANSETLDKNAVEDNSEGQGLSTESNLIKEQASPHDITEKADDTLKKAELESSGRKLPEEQAPNARSKLKRLIVSTRFIKAMDRLRKSRPQKRGYLFRETSAEAETVHLKHVGKYERKNAEEWMLDYALREVISKLTPAEQRRVARVIEAFESVTPEQKEMSALFPMGTKSASSTASAITEQEEDTEIPEDHEVKVYSSSIEFGGNGLKSNNICNLHPNNLARGCLACDPLRLLTKDMDHTEAEPEPQYGSLQRASWFNHSEQEQKNIHTKGTPLGKQNYTSLWNLIYLHAQSGNNSTEVGSQLQEVKCKGEQLNDGNTISEADTEPDEEIVSSGFKRIELTQSNAVQLVQEALEGILHGLSPSSENQSYLAPTNLHQNLPDEDKGTDRVSDVPMIFSSTNHSLEGEKNHVDLAVEPDASTFSKKIITHVEQENEAPESPIPEPKVHRGFSKLKKAILCNKFIRAMEKMQKFYAQKPRGLPIEPDPEAESVRLRPCLADQRKSREGWMLDNALQQAIAKLDPDKKRRVALIVRAFDTLNADLGETSIQPRSKRSGNSGACSLAENVDRKEDRIRELHGNLDPKQEDNPVLSTMKTAASRVPGKVHELRKSNWKLDVWTRVDENARNGITDNSAATRANSSESLHPVTEASKRLPKQASDCTEASDPSAQPEGFMDDCSIPEEADDTEHDCGVLAKSEVGEEARNTSAEAENQEEDQDAEYRSENLKGTEKYGRMWQQIYHRVRSLAAERVEAQMQGCEMMDVHLAVNESESEPGMKSQGSSQSSSESNGSKAQEEEEMASKQVSEAVDRTVVTHHQTSGDPSSNEDKASDQEIFRQKHTGSIGPSIRGSAVAALQAQVEEEEPRWRSRGSATGEQLPNKYSKLSKVILIKRFIKTVEKMRKLKARGARYIHEQPLMGSEHTNLKHQGVSGRKRYEDWMIDYALQEVIGKLASTRRKRVAMLVEAFESVKPPTPVAEEDENI